MRKKIEQKAYAKVNIGLDVTGKLENGYHLVNMVMQTISLYDRVVLEPIEEPGIVLSADRTDLGSTEKNLAYRAARLMMEEFSLQEGIKITLEKRIPVAAGLAGGSSDAAAVLRGMNQMYQLGLSLGRLQELGLSLGADVPYCLAGGTCLAQGIGEKLSPVHPMPECGLLLVKPPVSVSTKWVYENLQMEQAAHPDMEGLLRQMEAGSLEGIMECMGNILESVTCRQYPIIEEIKASMGAAGAGRAMMSGSGPSVFGMFQEKEKLRRAALEMKREYPQAEVFETELVFPSF